MLDASLAIPALARRSRSDNGPQNNFPQGGFAFWEGQGQSNMTGFNEIGDAPAALRVINPHMEMLRASGEWVPYGLLATGESATFDGVTYDGKRDEFETPEAAGGAGPMIGLHEAITDGAMQGASGFVAAKLLAAKFSDAGKTLDEFLPGFDEGAAPMGGANLNIRGTLLPGALRARLAAGDALYHQGKIWAHGEANAAAARAAADIDHVTLTSYAAGLASIRAFEREQFGLPNLPWHMIAIAEADQYDAAINDALASLCRWRVSPGGLVEDLGEGRDATSYIIDHMILPVGDVHFNMTQMRAIGALVWEAHLHHAGQWGATIAHRIAAIRPVWQTAPAATETTSVDIKVEGVANEDGAIFALALPAGSPPPTAAAIVATGATGAGLRGRAVSATVAGLDSETAYDVWSVYRAESGDLSTISSVTETTAVSAPAAGWSPGDAGALAWWDAQDAATIVVDAGAVASWSDKSGGGANLSASATAQRPALNPTALNGFPAVDFNGDHDLEGTGASLSADMCLLAVAEIDLVTNGSEALLHFQTVNLAIRAQNATEFRARYELMNGANTNISPSPVTDYKGAPHIFVSRYDSAADLVEVWIDGVLVASQGTYTVDLSGPRAIRLMRPWGTALRLDGKVGEVAAIASSAIADRERLEGYAAHRWGLAGLLPVSHPWKSAAP